MQSSKMKAKDGSTIELVDNRISDADISQWNANAGQNFFATYGTTTIAEIEAAHAAGKAIFMSNGPLIIPLSVVSNGTAQFTRSGGKDAVPLGRHMRAGRNKN